MKQRAFEQKFASRWRRFERQIRTLESIPDIRLSWSRPNPNPDANSPAASAASATPTSDSDQRTDDGFAGFPRLYRAICRDLALAQQRSYSAQLIDRLNRLALGGHRQLYWRHTEFALVFMRFVTRDFPRELRAHWRAFAVASALFCLPALVIFGLVMTQPELVYSVIDPAQVSEFEMMYDPDSSRIGTNRSAETDIYMFGFYIFNNIGVSFRTFAGGLAFGLGSVFFLVFNSLLLGALSAHVIQIGFQETFFSFVIGHGSFELTAIVISGAAGLILGHALIAPGPRSRVAALRTAAQSAMQLIYGVVIMLVIAALLEAFWSSKGAIPAEIKYAVGATLWLLVFLYFTLLGRPRGS